MRQLNELDLLRVVAGSQLGSDDIQVLSLLYQPLIGSDSFALYFALYMLIDRQKMTSEKLITKEVLDILNMNIQAFLVAKNKLEGVGLLRLLKGNDNFLFFLNLPLSARNFMLSDLGPFLYYHVGEALYKKLNVMFSIEKVSRDEYIEVTKSFDEVFESTNCPKISSEAFLMEKKRANIEFKNYSFDIDNLLLKIKPLVDLRRITEKVKRTITRIAYTYGFDLNDMTMVCHRSINAQAIDTSVLSKKAREYYEEINSQKEPKLVLKEEELGYDSSTRFGSAMKVMKTFTLKDIILSHIDSNTNIDAEITKFSLIGEKTDWPIGVLNAFAMYIVAIKDMPTKNKPNPDGKIPPQKYLDLVSETWISKGIDNEEKACSYIIDGKNYPKTPNEGTTKESTPFNKEKEKVEWIDEWYKKIGDIKYE